MIFATVPAYLLIAGDVIRDSSGDSRQITELAYHLDEVRPAVHIRAVTADDRAQLLAFDQHCPVTVTRRAR